VEQLDLRPSEAESDREESECAGSVRTSCMTSDRCPSGRCPPSQTWHSAEPGRGPNAGHERVRSESEHSPIELPHDDGPPSAPEDGPPKDPHDGPPSVLEETPCCSSRGRS